ncbi:MAG: hypothetical protein K8S16_12045 [Bacteroidales bacterium]|nr:hypothetical protein [Bacteroidales bacterium]
MEAKFTELIDKYLSGELKGEGLILFKEKLKTDKQLQKELRLHHDLDTILEEDVLDFREKVAEEIHLVKGEGKSGSTKTKLRIIPLPGFDRKWMLLAASVVILIGTTVSFYFLKDTSWSNEQLFAEYYSPHSVSLAVRSDILPENDPLVLGLAEYEKTNYPEAINYFESSLQNNLSNLTTHFYLGISYIETNDLAKAGEHFKYIIDKNGLLFTEQAKWYLALIYLKSGENEYPEKIREYLISIIDTKGDRADEAKKILENLK